MSRVPTDTFAEHVHFHLFLWPPRFLFFSTSLQRTTCWSWQVFTLFHDVKIASPMMNRTVQIPITLEAENCAECIAEWTPFYRWKRWWKWRYLQLHLGGTAYPLFPLPVKSGTHHSWNWVYFFPSKASYGHYCNRISGNWISYRGHLFFSSCCSACRALCNWTEKVKTDLQVKEANVGWLRH